MVILDSGTAMDLTFTLSDIIIILSIIAGGIAGWVKMVRNDDRVDSQIFILADKLKEHKEKDSSDKKEFFEKYQEYKIHSSNGRKAEKKEIMDMVEKQIQTTHARIDRVRDDNIKSYEKLEKEIAELRKEQTAHTEKILEAISKKRT